jgi:hypothetical protein
MHDLALLVEVVVVDLDGAVPDFGVATHGGGSSYTMRMHSSSGWLSLASSSCRGKFLYRR